jgi:ubiquinone biosynthesis protein Coq4
MNRLEILREMVKVWKSGEYFGDLVVLKTSLGMGSLKPSPEIQTFLDSYESVPDFSDIDFESLPENSLGKAYIEFLQKNHLKPLRFSNRYLDLMKQHKLAILYTSVHDIFHVLTGFDTSLAGEAGVWSFVAAQNISPQAETAAKAAKFIYPLISPFQRKRILAACEEGSRNGKAAQCLLKVDFKQEFSRSLIEVRSRYGVKVTEIF